ncbi:MAG TPA: VOC family protein [Vulgatibacter sp.]|nr:VOC family protein [Vulgatibacter sp.]
MARMIFLNLPVKDLDRSKAFFTALGFEFNPQFTDDTAACMVVNEQAFVMLITEKRFRDFTDRRIADTASHTEALVAVSAGSREEVDAMHAKALASGGSAAMPAVDYGFMYYQSFYDPDGHHWEVTWMDPAAVQKE